MLDGFRKDYISQKTPFLLYLQKKFGLNNLKQPFGFKSITGDFFTTSSMKYHQQFTLYKKRDRPLKYNFYKLIPKFFKDYIFNLFLYISGKKIAAPCIPTSFLKYFELSQTDYLKNNFMVKAKSFLIFDWPFIFYKDKEKVKTKLMILANNDKKRAEKFLTYIGKTPEKELYYFHFIDVDKYAHKYGIGSKELERVIIQTDALLKKLLSKFNLEEDCIVIWSDHGMLKVKKLINLQKILPKFGRGYFYFFDSTLARFWFFSDEKRKQIESLLKKQKFGHLLSKKELNKYEICGLDKAYGELFFLLNDGNLIFPNFFQTKNPAKAMHGYSLKSKDEQAFFISNQNFPKTLKTRELSKKIAELIGK